MPPVRGTSPIDANVTCRATGAPRSASESSHADTGFGIGEFLPNDRSPPSSARDCVRADCATLLAKESMATSAATPSAMDDM
ncbi:hypothetical protein J421_3688 [Gemmatirosa kalamazoonensis]|uniref:Uncharacterized protein n=1 Tax=Gemmatirosa kalamazoonensis TaxID=861299 RepID=W0RLP1_9BACT|nr:hypothetical protein J421_3688 [Gemmatirosa kalamazoonensis]